MFARCDRSWSGSRKVTVGSTSFAAIGKPPMADEASAVILTRSFAVPDVDEHVIRVSDALHALAGLLGERDGLKARLEQETDEYDQILGRQSELLIGVANALKGEPFELVMHDWSDLPAVAATVVAERDRLRAATDG